MTTFDALAAARQAEIDAQAAFSVDAWRVAADAWEVAGELEHADLCASVADALESGAHITRVPNPVTFERTERNGVPQLEAVYPNESFMYTWRLPETSCLPRLGNVSSGTLVSFMMNSYRTPGRSLG